MDSPSQVMVVRVLMGVWLPVYRTEHPALLTTLDDDSGWKRATLAC